jgi:hypothetical protein
MISENLTRDIELGDNLIEYEEGDNIPIGFNHRHVLNTLIKLFDDHDNVFIPPDVCLFPPAEVGLQSMKSTPYLVKGPTVMTG